MGRDEDASSDFDDEGKIEFDFIKCIILKDDSRFIFCWRILNAVACVSSSYIYAYMACFGFGTGLEQEFLKDLDKIFFSIFSTSIIINCLTEFYPEGEIVPCRDIEKIIQRYG